MRKLTEQENIPYELCTPKHFKSLCTMYGFSEKDLPQKVCATLARGLVPKKSYIWILYEIQGMDAVPYTESDRMPDPRNRIVHSGDEFRELMKKLPSCYTMSNIASVIKMKPRALQMSIKRNRVKDVVITALKLIISQRAEKEKEIADAKFNAAVAAFSSE
jgi:hypothetical protein